MIHLFLDTNVVLDFLSQRKPFAHEAAKLFDYSYKNKIKLFVSAVSYNNIYYILRQSLSNMETMKLLVRLNEWTETIDVTKEIINESLRSSFKDFEDSIQYHCAVSNSKIEVLVTRDTKDFRHGHLPVLNPKEVISLIENKNK